MDCTKEDQRELIQTEAELLQLLEGHPNVVKLDHILEFQNYVILGLELINGPTIIDYAR